MKNIFKIHISTYIFYLLLIFSGYINYFINYLIVVFIHEIGHIIFIKLFKYKIESINVYPTGFIINTNINLNIESNKLFLISIGGILNQIILFIILFNSSNYILKDINIFLLIFNLLPIYPLDGYKIILSILERIIYYKLSLKIINYISIIVLFIFSIISKNMYILIYLYIININNYLNIKYYYNKFLLERILYKFKYNNIKFINDLNKVYKNKYNIINGYDEEYVIKRYFS